MHDSLGLLHLRRGDSEAAEAAFRRAASIREETLGERHRFTLNSNAGLAAALVLGNRPAEAERVARRVVEMQESIDLQDPVLAGSARRTWGRSLTALARFAEAEEQLLEAYALQEAELGLDHRHTQETVLALVSLYEAWGRPERADEWTARRSGRA